MSKFVLNCESVSQAGETLTGIGSQMGDMEGIISGYNVSEATEFNFPSALKAIASNVKDSSEKINNTQKLLSTVVETHSNLQNSFVYTPSSTINVSNNKSATESSNTTPSVYTVVAGDNLTKIAKNAGVTLDALLAANTIENKNLIHPGDKINIPATDSTNINNNENKQEIKSNSNVNLDSSNGKTINIPDGLGDSHSYMGWQLITAKDSTQYKLKDSAGMNFDSEGFGKIDDRYVVACTDTYGNVGDYVDFKQSDGTVIKGIIGDLKNQSDAGCTKWGHENGNNVVEFVVDKNTWYNTGHDNPGTSSCHPEWNKSITSTTNYGNYFDKNVK